MQQPEPGPPVPPPAYPPVPPSAHPAHPTYPYHPPAGPYPQYPRPPYAYPPPPYGGYPAPYRPVAVVGLPRPTTVVPVADSGYAVALVEVRPTVSGLAAASLVAGIASILVALVVALFAVLGRQDGWGHAVAGAFAILSALLGVASVNLAVAGRRSISRSAPWGATAGRGAATAGKICGFAGIGITVLALLASLPAL